MSLSTDSETGLDAGGALRAPEADGTAGVAALDSAEPAGLADPGFDDDGAEDDAGDFVDDGTGESADGDAGDFVDDDSGESADDGLVGLGLADDDGSYSADQSGETPRPDVKTLLPLLIAAVVGALAYVVVLVACLDTLGGQDVRTNPGWDWFLVVGAAFSVAAATVTIRFALRAPLGWRLPLLAAAAWLGVVWPLPLAACLVYYSVRVLRDSAAWLRAGIVVAALAVLAAGGDWGLHASTGDLHRVPLATSDLVGTWRSATGAEVTIAADGSYTATTPTPFLPDVDGTGSPSSPGFWVVQDDGSGHTVVWFTPGATPERRGVLTAYSVASRHLLCVEDDPGDVCATAFQRGK